ncbi:MAG: hypothetical protein ACRDZ7_17170, partial [Acidimicrobiia bacterium]
GMGKITTDQRGAVTVLTLNRPDSTRRWAPVAAVATTAAALFLGLPLGGAAPSDGTRTVAVSPAVHASLPGMVAH